MPRTGPRAAAGIVVRLTPEEHATLTAAAQRLGLPLGPWLRSLGMREAQKRERPAARPRRRA